MTDLTLSGEEISVLKIIISDYQSKTKPVSLSIQKKKTSKKNQISENFYVTNEHRELAIQNGWPNPDNEIEAFKDYHLARGTIMKDWNRAFYTWLRNAKKFNGVNQNAKTGNRVSQREQAIINTIETCLPEGYGF